MVSPPLTKQLLQLHHPDQKYSNEAIELSTELLKLFIVEARRRAKIEVSYWLQFAFIFVLVIYEYISALISVGMALLILILNASPVPLSYNTIVCTPR